MIVLIIFSKFSRDCRLCMIYAIMALRLSLSKEVHVAESTMTADARRRAILERLVHVDGPHNVEQLRAMFGVSVATVRRDLERLSRDGLITRTYGGAVLGSTRVEQSLREREFSHASAKNAIALEAATLVSPGATVILDAGTTTGRLSHFLTRIPGLTVFTSGLNSLNTFAQSEGDTQVIVIGGLMRQTNLAMSGPIAEAALHGVYADVAFLGADSVHPRLGFSSRTMGQSALKTLMATRARRVVILADSSKFDDAWATYWTEFPVGCELITDADIDDEVRAEFASLDNMTMIVASAEPKL
jgi:DeoR/GlpR family transcriptional regulator of sugar metabolism